MIHSLARAARLTLLALPLSLAGCASMGGSGGSDRSAQNEWPSVSAQASQEAQTGRYGIADRLLSDFATRYPGTEPGTEAQFWRALYRLDPANQNASAKEAIAMLDVYLASPLSAARRPEALTLRRIAAALDAKPTVVTVTTPAAGAPPKADNSSAKDDEVARLKDELSKANAELERIKRRLAAPKP